MTMLRAFLSFMLVASTSAVYNIQGHLVCTNHHPKEIIAADEAVDDVWVQLYYMDQDTVQTYCTPFKIGGDDLRQTAKMVRKGVSRGIRCINECILYDKYHDGDAIRSVAFFHDKEEDRHCYCSKVVDRETTGVMSTCRFKHSNDYLDLIRAKHDSRVSRNGKQMISLNNNDNFIHLEGAAGRTDDALMLMVKVTNSKCDGALTPEEEEKTLQTNNKYDGFDDGSANFITMGKSTFGEWEGKKLICRDGVRGFRLKVDSEAIGDSTGLNGIKLKCPPNAETSELTAQWGTWKTPQLCNRGTHVVSFQLRGEENEGTKDKAAAHNVRMRCGDGIELDGGGRRDGHWEPYKSCPGRSYFCGVQVSIQAPQPYGRDNTALNKIRFYCCTASVVSGDVDLERVVLVGEITVTGESGVEVSEKKMTIYTRTDTGMWIECNSFTHSGSTVKTLRCRKRTVARYVRIAPSSQETLRFTVKVTKAKPSMAFRKPAKPHNDVQQVTTYSHDADKAVDGIYDSTYAEAYGHWSVDLKELITIDKIIIYLAKSFYSGEQQYRRISQLKVQTNRWNLDTWTPCNDAQATECVRHEPKSDLSIYPDIFRKDNDNGNDIFRKEETCDSGTMARAVRINNNCGLKMHLYEVEVLEANVVWFDTPYNCFDDLTPQFGCKNLKFDLATGKVTQPSGSIGRQTHEEAEAEGTESLVGGKPDPSSLFNTIELVRGERKLAENTLIKTVNVGKEYILTFEVNLLESRFGNVLFSRNQISADSNYGDGGPAVFFESSGAFTIYSFLSGKQEKYETTKTYQLSRWITIEVRQLLEGGKYMRSIIIDHDPLDTTINTNPTESKRVKVYASGHIRQLTFGKPVYYKIWSRMLNTPLYPGHGSSHEWLERSKCKTLARVHNSEITIEETFISSFPDVLFWKLEKVETIDSKDYYKIINKDTGGAILDTHPKAQVEKNGNNGKHDNQLWEIVKTDDGYYTFVGKEHTNPLYADDYYTKVRQSDGYRSTGRDLWDLQKITPTL